MKASRSRRGRGKPFGVGGPRRKGRGKWRATRGALLAPPEAQAPAPEPVPEPILVAEAEERIVADQDAPPPAVPPAPARRALWPLALPLLLLLVFAGGVAWFLFLREPPPPAGSEVAGATTAVDLVELKQLLRRLDFSPGPDDAGLDPATKEAIRQFQHDAGLPESGEPSAALLDELQQVVAPLKAN
jgi:hypothetical protein